VLFVSCRQHYIGSTKRALSLCSENEDEIVRSGNAVTDEGLVGHTRHPLPLGFSR